MKIEAQPITDIAHPVDGIGDAGIAEVRALLVREGIIDYSFQFDEVFKDVGSEWVVKKGKYAGTFPKRIAKSIKAIYKKKIDPKILGNLGELAKRHTVEARGYRLDFTSSFDWRAGAFGDEGSCFWGDHSGALAMIAEAGGLAVRFYDDDDRGYGRAWMIPFGKHWIIFNAYGRNLTTITVARILATEMGWSYKRISFTNNGSYDNTLWINGGMAYLIGETGKIDDYNEIDLDIDDIHRCGYVCYMCNEQIDDYYTVFNNYYCHYCYEDNFFFCNVCGEDRHLTDMITIHRWSNGGYSLLDYCNGCIPAHEECRLCHRQVDTYEEVEGAIVCLDCIDDLDTCDDCNEYMLTPHTHIDYPRNTNGTFANRVDTVRCHSCHFNGDWRDE